ncbi:chitinase, partial [Phenoliferia sp. Uapishka_3]
MGTHSLPLLLVLVLSLLPPGSTLPEPHLQAERRSTCPPGGILNTYWAPWKDAIQSPAQFPWNAVTNFAIYSFAKTTPDPGTLELDDGHIVEFVNAAHNAGKRALLAVGGATGTKNFSPNVGTAPLRLSFSQTIFNTVLQYGFDGADIDWEFPNYDNGNIYNAADSDNLLSFLAVLRQTMGSKLITMAAPPYGWIGSNGKHLPNTTPYATYIDYMTIMAYNEYDHYGADVSGPQSPMGDCDPAKAGWSSVPDVVGYWTNSGFPACQLLLGIATYAHTFVTSSSSLVTTYFGGQSTTAFQPTQKSDDAQPRVTEMIPDVRVSEALLHNTHNSPETRQFLSSDLTTGAGGYIRSYEDAQSTGIKAQWASTHGLAGITLYDSVGITSPVLSAAQQGLRGSFATSEPTTSPSNGNGGLAVSSRVLFLIAVTKISCKSNHFACDHYLLGLKEAIICFSRLQQAFLDTRFEVSVTTCHVIFFTIGLQYLNIHRYSRDKHPCTINLRLVRGKHRL